MKIIRITIVVSIVIAFLLVPHIGNAWMFPILNTTKYGAWLEINYVGCTTDHVVVQPGQTIQVEAHGCLVNRLSGVLAGQGKRFALPEWKVSGHRDFSATIIDKGSEKFDIHASYLGAGDVIQRDLIKPTEQAFVQLGKDIETEVIKPIEKAFSKESVQQVGQDIEKSVIKPIETAFVSLGKDIEKAFVDLGVLLEKKVADPIVAAGDAIVAKFNDCGAVVALGSEWAAKKSAYEAAKGALEVAGKINDADPLQYGVYAVKEAALLGLDEGKLGAEGLAHMIEGMGVIIGGGFNITEVSFDFQATELVQGTLPLFQVKGVFFGEAHTLTFQFDVNNPEKSMEAIVKELIKLAPGV